MNVASVSHAKDMRTVEYTQQNISSTIGATDFEQARGGIRIQPVHDSVHADSSAVSE
jgi:hypothetical protein